MIRLDEKALKGSFPPLVTPFKEDGSVDYDTYGKLVEFHVQGGSPGIVVTGTTGEPSVLTPAERTQLVEGVAGLRQRGRIVFKWSRPRAPRATPTR